MSEQRTGSRPLIRQPHAEDGVKRRPTPHPAAQGKERDMVKLSRRLHQDAAQFCQRANRLAGQVGNA